MSTAATQQALFFSPFLERMVNYDEAALFLAHFKSLTTKTQENDK
jgi:hypothetical protein